MERPHHIGLIVRSPIAARIRELLDDYTSRVSRDYHASQPLQDKLRALVAQARRRPHPKKL